MERREIGREEYVEERKLIKYSSMLLSNHTIQVVSRERLVAPFCVML